MIKVLVKCPHCGAKFSVIPEALSKNKKCTSCGELFCLIEFVEQPDVYVPTQKTPLGDGVFAPQIKEPSWQETSYKPMGSSPANPIGAMKTVRPSRGSIPGVPSYWAVRDIIWALNGVAIFLAISALITFATIASRDFKKDIKEASAKLGTKLDALPNAKDFEESMTLKMEAREIEAEVNQLKFYQNNKTSMLLGTVVGACGLVVLIVAFAQVLGMWRDTARNSFC